MKNWNIPTVEELEVKLTASSGRRDVIEKGANAPYDDPNNQATYDSTMWEKLDENDTCTVAIGSSANVES